MCGKSGQLKMTLKQEAQKMPKQNLLELIGGEITMHKPSKGICEGCGIPFTKQFKEETHCNSCNLKRVSGNREGIPPLKKLKKPITRYFHSKPNSGFTSFGVVCVKCLTFKRLTRKPDCYFSVACNKCGATLISEWELTENAVRPKEVEAK